MTDYRRMIWQNRANRCAEATAWFCMWTALPGEFMWGIYHHFPWWDAVMMPITALLWQVAKFIDHHTRIYRIDL